MKTKDLGGGGAGGALEVLCPIRRLGIGRTRYWLASALGEVIEAPLEEMNHTISHKTFYLQNIYCMYIRPCHHRNNSKAKSGRAKDGAYRKGKALPHLPAAF